MMAERQGWRGTRRSFVAGLAAFIAVGCQPGLGAQLSSKDYAFTFTRRDLAAIHGLSTPSFREAVWDRVSAKEFPAIARLMGHSRHMDVVDTKFDGDRALIQMRTESRRQYRLHAVRIGEEWLVDDVLEELEPAVYVSKRRQAEAVLAVRDFRIGLAGKDGPAMVRACSSGFSRVAWERMTPHLFSRLGDKLSVIAEETGGKVADVRSSKGGSPSAEVRSEKGVYVFYFVSERGRLVVDDVSLPKGPPSLRVRLRNELMK